MENISDVLIVGGGIAGLYAAISAKKYNPKARVTMLISGVQGAGGCSRKTHGINAALNHGDSWQAHSEDTMIGGGYINNPLLVDILTKEVIERIEELESWGVNFSRRKDGSFEVGTYGGSSTARSVHWYDMTGLQIVQKLVQKVVLSGCYIKEKRWAVELIVNDGSCNGVVAYNKEKQTLESFYSKTVVMATGGGACVYPISTISNDKLASGILMSFKNGAELIDMEMVQFHPTGLVKPNSSGHGEIMEEELRTWGGKLRNRFDQRYMPNYDERDELATRDIVARSSYLEIINDRGTKNGGVILDLTEIDRHRIAERFPLMLERLRSYGVDLMMDRTVEISPTAHYLMGGLLIDKECRTNIKGLFAAGEDAGGIDGGNRLGGNGVAGTLVFGYRAGKYAAISSLKNTEYPKIQNQIKLDYYDISTKEYGLIEKELKKIMWENVGLVRDEKGLKTAKIKISDFKSKLELKKREIHFDGGKIDDQVIKNLILWNKLILSELITRSALERKNSVGAHYRADGREEVNSFNISIKKVNEKIVVKRKEINYQS